MAFIDITGLDIFISKRAMDYFIDGNDTRLRVARVALGDSDYNYNPSVTGPYDGTPSHGGTSIACARKLIPNVDIKSRLVNDDETTTIPTIDINGTAAFNYLDYVDKTLVYDSVNGSTSIDNGESIVSQTYEETLLPPHNLQSFGYPAFIEQQNTFLEQYGNSQLSNLIDSPNPLVINIPTEFYTNYIDGRSIQIAADERYISGIYLSKNGKTMDADFNEEDESSQDFYSDPNGFSEQFGYPRSNTNKNTNVVYLFKESDITGETNTNPLDITTNFGTSFDNYGSWTSANSNIEFDKIVLDQTTNDFTSRLYTTEANKKYNFSVTYESNQIQWEIEIDDNNGAGNITTFSIDDTTVVGSKTINFTFRAVSSATVIRVRTTGINGTPPNTTLGLFTVRLFEDVLTETPSNVVANIENIKPYGICFLDKGFILITDTTLASFMNGGDYKISYRSLATNYVQLINAAITPADFNKTTNNTYSGSGNLYITEVGFYNSINELLFLGKFGEPVEKIPNENSFTLSTRISL